MDNILLLNLLEKVLGKSTQTTDNNYKFHCGNCNHSKKKLEINLDTQQWQCWVCGNRDNFKGTKLSSLFKKLHVTGDNLTELTKLTKGHTFEKSDFKSPLTLELPKEYTSLSNVSYSNIMARHAKLYLEKRGVTDVDILRYNIGFCEDGEYKNMIVIPSYDENFQLNWYSTRCFDDAWIKTKNPTVTKNIIGFESLINWNVPIIICEGAFDAISARRNAIPLFGKVISETLMKKIVTNQVDKIYIALDKDALKDALKHCETLLSYNKEVYLVKMDDKDINAMGFEKFTKMIQKVQPLTFSQLLKTKMEL